MNHVAVITEKGIRRKGEAADVAKMPAAPCLAIEIVAGDLGVDPVSLQDGCTISRVDDAATKLAA